MRRDLALTPRWLLTAVAVALVAGCSSPAEVPTPTTSVSAPTSTASTSPQDIAIESAIAAIRRYYEVTDELFQNVQLPIDQVASVADGEELDSIRSQLQAQRVRGEVQSGAVVVDSATATSADLGTPATVTLDVCLDVSAVDVVGADGQSVLTADRAGRAQVTITVVETGDRGWLVERSQASGSACTGS